MQAWHIKGMLLLNAVVFVRMMHVAGDATHPGPFCALPYTVVPPPSVMHCSRCSNPLIARPFTRDRCDTAIKLVMTAYAIMMHKLSIHLR